MGGEYKNVGGLCPGSGCALVSGDFDPVPGRPGHKTARFFNCPEVVLVVEVHKPPGGREDLKVSRLYSLFQALVGPGVLPDGP